MRIGYIVDHPKRDLSGGIMFARALAQRGVETALIPLYEQGHDVPLLGLDGLVVNYARRVNLELVRSLELCPALLSMAFRRLLWGIFMFGTAGD
jgi:hypothetical protein